MDRHILSERPVSDAMRATIVQCLRDIEAAQQVTVLFDCESRPEKSPCRPNFRQQGQERRQPFRRRSGRGPRRDFSSRRLAVAVELHRVLRTAL